MMKFFRKYNKHLLAVFASLLLVIWLGADALQSLLSPDIGGDTYGKAYGQTITNNDLRAAQSTTDMLSSLGIPWTKPWVLDPRNLLYDQHEPLSDLEWLLLSMDAQRRGVTVTRAGIENFKQFYGLTQPAMERIANQRRVSTDALDAAIGEFLRVRGVYERIESGIQATDPEMRLLARQRLEKVEVRLVGVPAAAFVDRQAPVSEEEMVRQFEQYRDRLPGQEGLGFGYTFSDRVGLEYIVADADKVAATIPIPRAEAKAFWEEGENKKSFRKPRREPATRPAETQAADESPQTQPATAPGEEVAHYETFMEAAEEVIRRLQKQRAPQEAQRLLNELLATNIVPLWENAQTGEDGFRVAPEAVKAAGFTESAILSFVSRQPAYAGVFTVRRTEPLTRDSIQELEGIGKAFTQQAGGQRVVLRIADLAFRVQGLVEPPKEADVRREDRPLAIYEFCPLVLRGPGGSAYTFRVLEARKSAAPESLDEVREAVERDIRLARGYEQAQAAARELEAASRGSGLEEAWNSAEALRERVREAKSGDREHSRAWGLVSPPAFAREEGPGQPGEVLGLVSKSLVHACFAAATSEDLTAERKPVVLVEVPEHQLVAVVEVHKFDPVYEEDYLTFRPQFRQVLRGQRLETVAENWFDPEKVQTRAGFERAQ